MIDAVKIKGSFFIGIFLAIISAGLSYFLFSLEIKLTLVLSLFVFILGLGWGIYYFIDRNIKIDKHEYLVTLIFENKDFLLDLLMAYPEVSVIEQVKKLLIAQKEIESNNYSYEDEYIKDAIEYVENNFNEPKGTNYLNEKPMKTITIIGLIVFLISLFGYIYQSI